MITRIRNVSEKIIDISNSDQYSSQIKPRGIWYGINNSWIDWCRDNMPEWVKKYNYEFNMDINKILIITNIREFNNFVKDYKLSTTTKFVSMDMDWKKVAQNHSGIEIQNYEDFGGLRLKYEYIWLKGWDCSSGCIWDISAITNYYLNK